MHSAGIDPAGIAAPESVIRRSIFPKDVTAVRLRTISVSEKTDLT
jgi:hypothetical protein